MLFAPLPQRLLQIYGLPMDQNARKIPKCRDGSVPTNLVQINASTALNIVYGKNNFFIKCIHSSLRLEVRI